MAGTSGSQRRAQGERGDLGPVVDLIIWKEGWEGNKHLQRRIMLQVSGSKLPRATRLPGLGGAATGVLSILLMFRD